MRFLSVRELKAAPGRLWSGDDSEDIIVTANGHPIALLTRIDDASFEAQLEARRRARSMTVFDRAYREAAASGADTMTNEEIDAEIQAARRERHVRH